MYTFINADLRLCNSASIHPHISLYKGCVHATLRCTNIPLAAHPLNMNPKTRLTCTCFKEPVFYARIKLCRLRKDFLPLR